MYYLDYVFILKFWKKVCKNNLLPKRNRFINVTNFRHFWSAQHNKLTYKINADIWFYKYNLNYYIELLLFELLLLM